MTKGIYQIRNNLNGKRYIGASVDMERRLKEHERKLSSARHPNNILQKAYNVDAAHFVFQMLEQVNDMKLIKEKEEFYIKLYQSHEPNLGYNRTAYSGYSPTKSTKGNFTVYQLSSKVEDLQDALISKSIEVNQLEKQLSESRNEISRSKDNNIMDKHWIKSNPRIMEVINEELKKEQEKADAAFERFNN